MELEKVTSKGRVIMMNSSIDALRKAQAAFAGEADHAGHQCPSLSPLFPALIPGKFSRKNHQPRTISRF